MGDNFYIGVLRENEGVALDESGFSRATYLELKADNVEEMREKIVAFGVSLTAVVGQARGRLRVISVPVVSGGPAEAGWPAPAARAADRD